MKPQAFEFVFSKAMLANAAHSFSHKRHNVQIRVKAMAYFYRTGEVRTVDVDEMFFHDEKVPDNFLWSINQDLYDEITAAAEEHAKDKWRVIETQPA